MSDSGWSGMGPNVDDEGEGIAGTNIPVAGKLEHYTVVEEAEAASASRRGTDDPGMDMSYWRHL